MHAKLMPGDRKQKTKAASGTQRSEWRGGRRRTKAIQQYLTLSDCIGVLYDRSGREGCVDARGVNWECVGCVILMNPVVP